MRVFDEALVAGERIADYEIKEVLGEPGSFGITYLAADLHLHRDVAIKEYFPGVYAVRRGREVMPRDDSKAGTFDWGLERFSEEARTLAQFNHRNIVRVLRLIADVNGTAYIVMDLAKGRTLESMVEENGPMDAATFNPIFDQLLDGCAAIHNIGILHRDIKPANIIVSPQGVPVLIDFGAARDLALQKKSGFTAIVTDTYSPPEQYSRELAQGPWTDIYALAATAYYALSGEAPPPSTARAIGDSTIPAVEAAAGRASPMMLKGLDHGLALSAKDRPQTVEQWRSELDLTPAQYAPAPLQRSFDRRAMLAIGGGVGLLGVVGVSFLFSGGLSGSNLLNDSSNPLKINWTKEFGEVDGDPWPAISISPRGAAIASRRLIDGQTHMLAAHVAGDGTLIGEWVATEPGSAAQAIVVTPDGGALVGGDEGGQARIVRLGPDWKPVWSRTYGDGEVRSIMLQNEGLVAAIGGDSGSAKLVVLDQSGQPAQAEVSLLDRKDDTVERVAAIAGGGYVVLGRRTNASGELNTTRLWVERLDSTYNSMTGRILEPGLGTTRGWAIIVIEDAIFVAGTTSKGRPDDPTHPILLRINAKDGSKTWTRAYEQVAHGSGRALALMPGSSRPSLYMAGTGGDPIAHARIVQFGDDGGEVWSMEAPVQGAAEAEGALALAFDDDGNGFAVGFTHSSQSTRLTVTRLAS